MIIQRANAHKYDRFCVCSDCAAHRVALKLAQITDFINWANAPLLAGLQRVATRTWDGSIDVPIDVCAAAGLKLPKKLTAPVVRLNPPTDSVNARA